MQTTLRDLTEEELSTLELDLDLAYSICKKYEPEFKGEFTVSLLTKVFELWLADNTDIIANEDIADFNSKCATKPTPKMVQFGLGAAYGEVLNEEFATHWKHITDEYGQEICIRHKNPVYTTFPYTIVSKRIDSKETNFFAPIMETMRYNITKN
ncbi:MULTISPECIES: DUF3806 domain-containing protein [Cellulophaga]|uniref:DUF3806 domain-containing protein n=2 Tax=Cellulophaga TaxID=104264 RepID=F0RDF0_CELLC|nr:MULTISPECIES: DUF3806 domain-containing protein [Cellulophaga]ADY30892.1 hypothetical protein Celly_3075 [Cellulophaga lytica DSM 7489]APU11780.1 hypothetical protein A5M85_16280 [Cellulophaga lytica]EWH12658.1 hypothetical protein KLA_13624 [Cellulophaga geojensis KL-A]TVZ09778.1 uncharacterized protein DUF3806 [Cellulophaga sp. RHA_52]WQG78190.1 DUF3806 domain-containing protein [Cellulophaga lytica]